MVKAICNIKFAPGIVPRKQTPIFGLSASGIAEQYGGPARRLVSFLLLITSSD